MTANIYLGDCMDILKTIPDASIDLLLTDPPYAVTQNRWDVKIPLDELWREWNRVCKTNAAMVFTSQFPFTLDLIQSNIKDFRYDLIWYKPLGTGFLNANRMPMRNHEHILVFYRELPTYNPQKGTGVRKKGNRKHDRNGTNYGRFATEGSSNYFDDKGERFPQSVIEFTNGDRTTENDHPTQKPCDLFRYLIKTYSNEKDVVLDCYSGSGTTGEASFYENRSCILIEKDPGYYFAAKKRIENHVQQLPLFGEPPTINFHYPKP